MKIKFIAPKHVVTGSKYLIESNKAQILLDFGLFQSEAIKENKIPENLRPKEIDAVCLSHSHIDHSGLLPLLVKHGFQGKIYCSPPTYDLVQILLEDSAFIQSQEQKPLYDVEDVKQVFPLLTKVEYEVPFMIQDIEVIYFRAGHILGASVLRLSSEGKSICFSGDLGRADDLIHLPPQTPPPVDLLMLESTYGSRNHKDVDATEILKNILEEVVAQEKIWLIPTFSVGRAQMLGHLLSKVIENNPKLKIPFFLHSPMTIKVFDLYRRFSEELKISLKDFDVIEKHLTTVEWGSQKKKVDRLKGPSILLATSGMLTGGPMISHLRAYGKDPNNLLTLVGYQAEGTTGRAIQDGVRKFDLSDGGLWIDLEVRFLDFFSAHAGQKDLIEFGKKVGKKILCVHGETTSKQDLARSFNELGIPAEVPAPGEIHNA